MTATTMQHARPTTRRRPAAALGDALLWVAAAAGVICIIAVIAAVGFHFTLIMFKTGSMSPTIPTGSLALVHEIPASQVHVGDIVTVDRPGELPVSHRVTAISEIGVGNPNRSITLRGDANPVEDPAPYVVSHVRLVMAWIPDLARVVVWFSNPFVLGALTLGATSLVTWAFWPREAPAPEPSGRRRRRARGVATASGAGLALVLAATFGAPPAPAQAAEVETVTSSAYLTLTSISDPDLLSSMTPMAPLVWQVGVAATPPEPGVVHLGIAATGVLTDPGDISIAVSACPTRWVAGACAAGATPWLATTDLASVIAHPTLFGAHEMGSMGSSAQRWLRITTTLTATDAVPGDSVTLRLQAWGVGSPLSTSPSGSLALTGGSGPGFTPALLALVAVAAGLVLAEYLPRRRGRALRRLS